MIMFSFFVNYTQLKGLTKSSIQLHYFCCRDRYDDRRDNRYDDRRGGGRDYDHRDRGYDRRDRDYDRHSRDYEREHRSSRSRSR